MIIKYSKIQTNWENCIEFLTNKCKNLNNKRSGYLSVPTIRAIFFMINYIAMTTITIPLNAKSAMLIKWWSTITIFLLVVFVSNI